MISWEPGSPLKSRPGSSCNVSSFHIKYIYIYIYILIIGLNISAISNNFLDYCSHFPCLHIWSGDPNFFWIYFSYRVKIRLHDKDQLPRLTENSLKVCMGGVGSHQLLCHSKLYFQLRCQLHITVSTIFLTNQTNFHISYTACILFKAS